MSTSFVCTCSCQGEDFISGCHLWNLLKIFYLLAPVPLYFLPLCLSYNSSNNFLFFSRFRFFYFQLIIYFFTSFPFPSAPCCLVASRFFFLSVIPFPSLPFYSTPLHFIFVECLLDKYPVVGGWTSESLFAPLFSLSLPHPPHQDSLARKNDSNLILQK